MNTYLLQKNRIKCHNVDLQVLSLFALIIMITMKITFVKYRPISYLVIITGIQ